MLSRRALSLLAAGIVMAAGNLPSAAAKAPARQSARVQSIAGGWVGQFLGTAFTFEFRPDGGRFAGRYRSAQYGKWHDLKNMTVAGSDVRFEFSSTPRIVVSLKRTD